jgi:opacity protein-like surface antigen
MTRLPAWSATLALLVLWPGAAVAQERLEVKAYGTVGVVSLDALETFEAIAESAAARVVGGGAQVSGFWRGAILEVSLTQSTINGERVFIDDEGEVNRLGLPLQVRLRPLDLLGGWRLDRGAYSWWAGGGVSRLGYDERSEDAVDGENVSTSAFGPLVGGGVDFRLSRRLFAGLEARYRHIGGILGEGGASAAFGETSAGGLVASVRVGVIVR